MNPETGTDVLPTLGFTAMFLPKGSKLAPVLRSSSGAFHIVKGAGRSTVDGQVIDWTTKDTFTTPVFAAITHEATEDSFVIRVHDRPLQEKLGYYEERQR